MSYLNSEQQTLREFLLQEQTDTTQEKKESPILPGIPDADPQPFALNLPEPLLNKLRPGMQAGNAALKGWENSL